MIPKWKHFQSKKGEKMAAKLQVTIWNEFYHEKSNPKIAEIYPDGLHKAIADGIAAPDLEIRLASLDQPECGLTDEVLAKTVLVSDAFFPFADNIEAAAAFGIRHIVEPGGSKKDADCIAACDARDIAMVFTGCRHFLH